MQTRPPSFPARSQNGSCSSTVTYRFRLKPWQPNDLLQLLFSQRLVSYFLQWCAVFPGYIALIQPHRLTACKMPIWLLAPSVQPWTKPRLFQLKQTQFFFYLATVNVGNDGAFAVWCLFSLSPKTVASWIQCSDPWFKFFDRGSLWPSFKMDPSGALAGRTWAKYKMAANWLGCAMHLCPMAFHGKTI